jgi:hypothetical protein
MSETRVFMDDSQFCVLSLVMNHCGIISSRPERRHVFHCEQHIDAEPKPRPDVAGDPNDRVPTPNDHAMPKRLQSKQSRCQAREQHLLLLELADHLQHQLPLRPSLPALPDRQRIQLRRMKRLKLATPF